MLRFEFEQIRDLPDKRIEGDLVFAITKRSRPSFVLSNVPVQNALGLDLVLDGLFNPLTRKLMFNFRVRGVGPICRLCVNGRLHDRAGRTHKHELLGEHDPANNLPNVLRRDDLRNNTTGQIWRGLCQQAHIVHTGTLTIPGEPLEAAEASDAGL